MFGNKVMRVVLVGLAAAGGALLAAAPAMAATADTGGGPTTAPGDLSPAGDLTPGGVPVFGLVQAVVGATKALPGQSGQGY